MYPKRSLRRLARKEIRRPFRAPRHGQGNRGVREGRGRATYETEVRKERQLVGIARAKADGKTWGGRKVGTRLRLTEEKEAVIRQLHGEGKAVASIARTVGLTRKTIYRALARAGSKP